MSGEIMGKDIDVSIYNKADWVGSIVKMHKKFGVNDWMAAATPEERKKFLIFRLRFLVEELNETILAYHEDDGEEVVDGLIDLCVVAIGTLDAFGIDSYRAWSNVMEANMAKEVGVKAERPNPLGLPDLVKPDDWIGPSHKGNGIDYEQIRTPKTIAAQ